MVVCKSCDTVEEEKYLLDGLCSRCYGWKKAKAKMNKFTEYLISNEIEFKMKVHDECFAIEMKEVDAIFWQGGLVSFKSKEKDNEKLL